jgi:uracil-DNA glycosylase
MSAAVRCAPPANKPEISERDACAPWLAAELRMLSGNLRVIVCLGHFAWQAVWPQMQAIGYQVPRPRPSFGHGVEAVLAASGATGQHAVTVLGCYHPSQQNTFTGKVTDGMLDAIFRRARDISGL